MIFWDEIWMFFFLIIYEISLISLYPTVLLLFDYFDPFRALSVINLRSQPVDICVGLQQLFGSWEFKVSFQGQQRSFSVLRVVFILSLPYFFGFFFLGLFHLSSTNIWRFVSSGGRWRLCLLSYPLLLHSLFIVLLCMPLFFLFPNLWQENFNFPF